MDLSPTSASRSAENLFAGHMPRVEKAITLKSGFGTLVRGTLLGRRDSDGKFAPIAPGRAYTAEVLGVGDGAETDFTGTLAHPGIKPGTVVVTATLAAGTETFHDNGDGTLDSDKGGDGTIIYATGVIDLNFNTAPKDDTNVLVAYTGLLTAYADEDIGTGTAGGQKEWAGYLAHLKVIPSSVRFYTNDTSPLVARDNGHGEIVGSATGSINYETGEYDINWETAPAETKTIHVEYCVTDGTDVLACILGVEDSLDTTLADEKAFGWFTGEFDRDGVTWPTGTSEAQKDEIILEAEKHNLHLKKTWR